MFTPRRFPVVCFVNIAVFEQVRPLRNQRNNDEAEERAGCRESLLRVVAGFGPGSDHRSGLFVVVVFVRFYRPYRVGAEEHSRVHSELMESRSRTLQCFIMSYKINSVYSIFP